MGGVLLGLDLGGAQLAVRADPLAHGGHRAFEQALSGELGLAGEIVERHGAFLLTRHASLLQRSMRPRQRCCNASFGPRR